MSLFPFPALPEVRSDSSVSHRGLGKFTCSSSGVVGDAFCSTASIRSRSIPGFLTLDALEERLCDKKSLCLEYVDLCRVLL